MINIQEILFFYSRYSVHCKTVTEFLKNYQIPMRLICVDSVATRKIISNYTLFKIKVVPTIVVSYEDSIEIFEGDKVIQWFKELIVSMEEAKQTEMESHLRVEQSLKPIQSGDGELEEEYEMLGASSNNSTIHQPEGMTSLSAGKPNIKELRMQDVKDMAKNMMAEREQGLERIYGYTQDESGRIVGQY